MLCVVSMTTNSTYDFEPVITHIAFNCLVIIIYLHFKNFKLTFNFSNSNNQIKKN